MTLVNQNEKKKEKIVWKKKSKNSLKEREFHKRKNCWRESGENKIKYKEFVLKIILLFLATVIKHSLIIQLLSSVERKKQVEYVNRKYDIFTYIGREEVNKQNVIDYSFFNFKSN